ncbi:MAG: DOMON-like domain-containing protein [Steroidobacteraceae bacterium]
MLRFQYVLEADLRHVCVPPSVVAAGRTDRLWARTCFEAFVGLPESTRYLELNFSPSGQWAAYCFDSYRQGMVAALDAAPRLALRRSGGRLELEAEVQLVATLAPPASMPRRSPGRSGDRRLRIGLSAVVEDLEGRLSYWALRHPPGRPDFHHPESFSLALELASHPLSSP